MVRLRVWNSKCYGTCLVNENSDWFFIRSKLSDGFLYEVDLVMDFDMKYFKSLMFMSCRKVKEVEEDKIEVLFLIKGGAFIYPSVQNMLGIYFLRAGHCTFNRNFSVS